MVVTVEVLHMKSGPEIEVAGDPLVHCTELAVCVWGGGVLLFSFSE